MQSQNRGETAVMIRCGASGAYRVLVPAEHCPKEDDGTLWQALEAGGVCDAQTVSLLRARVEEALQHAPTACGEQVRMHTPQGLRWFRADVLCAGPGEDAILTLTDVSDTHESRLELERRMHSDVLTGLLSRQAFCSAVDAQVDAGRAQGCAVVYVDVLRFKAINDLFGTDQGNEVLLRIADAIRGCLQPGECACRAEADHFMIWLRDAEHGVPRLMERLTDAISGCALPVEATFNAGVYETEEEKLSADAMIDRAALALSVIKGSYTVRWQAYREFMRNRMLSEHEIAGMSASALSSGQIIVYYQPQYSHSTGMVVGAEALARWQHPERGMIAPEMFIPAFERSGLITALDLYVFDQVCRMQRRCLDEGLPLVPVATNFSRYDIYQAGFVERLEEIRARWGVEARLLPIELTETVFIDGGKYANAIIRRLHECGYRVEMDDFGTGYSSLTVLKDTEVDGFKLDMGFLSEGTGTGRGGAILGSVVRMAKWLRVEIVAEGVETASQADYLRSLGCDCMQGYLYARPMPEAQYLALLGSTETGARGGQMEIACQGSGDFWNPDTQGMLVFNGYVGAAAVIELHQGQVEILRVNPGYLKALGMNLTEREVIESDLLSGMDADNRSLYMDMLIRARADREEHECETWRTVISPCCGAEQMCIRASARMLGTGEEATLYCVRIRNITGERRAMNTIRDDERRFRMASEQVNIYYWEYVIATREMRPCFRCMRDLGLPAVLTNYPESAFELGVFPPEVHDLYRSWHRQVAAGVPELEAIIPLTAERIPFRVRYTTEFDANGRPVRAYGSAALVKDAAARPSELDRIDSDNRRVLQLMAQHSDRVVLLYDLKTGSIRFNDEMDDQYGMNNVTIAQLFSQQRILPESMENARRILRNIERGVPYGRERIRFKYRESFFCWLDFKYTTLFDEEKAPVGAFLSYADITAQVEALERSRIDGMTGLYNRANAEKLMRERIEDASSPGILLLLDMDSLKTINDTYGHSVGDQAICSVASVLKGHFRSSDIVGRFGGDEFAVYLEDAASAQAAIARSVQALLDKLQQLKVNGSVPIHCSIGCAVQGEDASTFEELYRRADAALYAVKRSGKSRLAFYSPDDSVSLPVQD